jgi:hypothetical protein
MALSRHYSLLSCPFPQPFCFDSTLAAQHPGLIAPARKPKIQKVASA